MARKIRLRKTPKRFILTSADEIAIAEGCYFDDREAELPIQFVERFCRHSRGRSPGQPFTLLDWQRDYLRRLYGWRRADGLRRFRSSYLEVPKKNGKSTLISALSLYHLLADGEHGAECYALATTRAQALIVYSEAERMVRKSPNLARRLKIRTSQKTIYYPEAEAKLAALSADTKGQDGLNPSFAIFDELHHQPNPDLYELFEQAGAARRQYLLSAITTAGSDMHGVCRRVHNTTRLIESGDLLTTTHYGRIYAADENDDPHDPATWRKANPSLGYTISFEDFKAAHDAARYVPSQWASFLRYRLNLWATSSQRFLRMDRWAQCGDREIDEAELAARPCWIGIDLSQRYDLTAAAILTRLESGDYAAQWRYYAPEESAKERQVRDRVPYLDWARNGWLTLTPGEAIDYDFIHRDITTLCDRREVSMIGFDPWDATQFAQRLQGEGYPVCKVRQGFATLSAPTKELERLVISRRLLHGGNPITNWCASNAVVVRDSADNVKLDKAKSTERIDGLAALVNALAVAGIGEPEFVSMYETASTEAHE